MQRTSNAFVLSPTDLVNSTACAHLIQLERKHALRELPRPAGGDAQTEAIAKRGNAHERAYLAALPASQVVKIDPPESNPAGLRTAEAQTLAAMKSGAAYIYQPCFFDGTWRGQADFLKRVEVPSNLGAWSYEVIDTKLARRAKASAVLQMMVYAQHVERLQGRLPEHVHVALGSGKQDTFKTIEYLAYTRQLQRNLEAIVTGPELTTYPHVVQKCSQCVWDEVCEVRRRADDHLSYVANMRRSQIEKLAANGITTLEAFAASTPEPRALGIGASPLYRLHEQAKLQLRQRHETPPGERPHVSTLALPAEFGLGLATLPAPSEGDIYFDMEGDPLVDDVGLEYLFGVVTHDHGKAAFTPFWAHSRAEEKTAFEGLVDFITMRRQRWPDLHVYHYAPYETVALEKLAMRHATREDDVDDLLRGQVLVDLYRVVRQSLLVSQESYSIKKLEPLYMQARQAEVKDAGSSIVEYERYLELRAEGADASSWQTVLDNIEHYNREDCESTRLLHGWLEKQRGDAERVVVPEVDSAKRKAEDEEVERLGEALRAQGHALLSHLLSWHRREAKPEWWAFYTRQKLAADDLYADRECLAGLVYDGEVGKEKNSKLYQFKFDPAQEHKVVAGKKYLSVGDEKQHEVFSLDRYRGTLVIKKTSVPSLHALMPGKPLNTTGQQGAIAAVARAALSAEAQKYQAAFDLMERRRPRINGQNGGPLVEASATVKQLQALVLNLDGTCLPVQGPPGAGKTYVGARMIVALLQAGRRVGITANSHAVIGNLLREVMDVAKAAGLSPRAMAKADEDKLDPIDGVTLAKKNEEVEDALADGTVDLVTGTPWLMTREALRGRFDTLFVDEAGQLSLANAIAVSTCARNMVLLGDPRQLSQPSKGVHPEGAGVSALGHVIGTDHTISPEAGIFLATSRRMHPDVCAFISEVVYDGKLAPHPDCAKQRIVAHGALGGSGLRWASVEHVGNSTHAPQEADRVIGIVDHLVGQSWVNQRGQTQKLTPADVLIVAPFNVQVGEIATRRSDLRVGTVDKFQGQQAPVVIYSMTCSTAEDAPRDMEFLYELERLNVAVSRAQCMAILVCTPALLMPTCKTVEQLRLANAVCRFVEMATAL